MDSLRAAAAAEESQQDAEVAAAWDALQATEAELYSAAGGARDDKRRPPIVRSPNPCNIILTAADSGFPLQPLLGASPRHLLPVAAGCSGDRL